MQDLQELHRSVKYLLCISVFLLTTLRIEGALNDTSVSPESASERLSQYVQNIETFNRILPQEKVYLHFDNTAYYIGDTLWFAAYVVTAPDHRPTPLSRVLHVQLITREGTVMDTRVLKISEDGRCHGQFVLKSEYASGYYEVRAYTLYMLNFGNIQWDYEKEAAAFFFNEEYCRRFYQESGTAFSRVFPVYQKPLTPGNWNEKTIRTRPRLTGTLSDWWERDPKPVLKFYPEGGHLVEGLESRVAFEVCDAEGKPLQVKGEIEGRRGRTQQALRSNARGRGDFYYTPERGQRRRAVIMWEGKEYKYDLPEPLSKGYVMNVREDDKTQGNTPGKVLRVNVVGSDSLPSGSLGLTVVCRGQPYVFEELRTVRQSDGTLAARIDIDTDLLPEGVQQITLFDANGQIHAERMAFVAHPERRTAYFTITGIKRTAYKAHQRVALNIYMTKRSLKDDSFQALANTPFSLAVNDYETREETSTEENILSHLLLSSDLYGCIDAPTGYFKNGLKNEHELELLMLTQGWRRYDFEEMTGQGSFVYRFRPQQGLTVSGQVFPLTGSRAMRRSRLRNGTVEAFLTVDSLIMEGQSRLNAKGEFSFDVPDFDGRGHLYIRLGITKDSAQADYNKKDNFLTRYLRQVAESTIEKRTSEFYSITEYNGHLLDDYLPVKETWQPHVRLLSYFETHPKEYQRDQTLAEDMGMTVAEKGVGDEAYSLELKDVAVEGKVPLRTIDLSQPAIRLDAFDEMNLQLDLGMFYGLLTKYNLDKNAVMRHGIRGKGDIIDNYNMIPEKYGPIFEDNLGTDYDPSLMMEQSWNDHPKTESGIIPDEETLDAETRAITLNRYPGIRGEDQSYYLQRYMKFSSAAEMNVNLFRVPDSISYIRLPYFERLRQISIYNDKTDRRIVDISELRDTYSSHYTVHNEYFQDETRQNPVYRGRHLHFQGYSKPAEFYSPDYSRMDLKEPPKDYRRTLYWNPDVRTDSQGRAHIEFYNNSTARHLVISAEGLTPDGQPVVLKQ